MAGTSAKGRKNHNGEVEKLIDFAKICAILRKNWMVLKSDKLRLTMLMLFPLIMILLFGYTSGAAPKHIAAAVVDYDNSQTSRLVQEQLHTNELFSIQRQIGSQDEGRRLIESGDIKILFIIPSGFESDIDAGRTATMSIIVDESDPTVAQITRASTAAFMQGLSSQLATSRIYAIAAKPQQGSQSLAQANAIIGRTVERSDAQSFAQIQDNFKDAQHTAAGTGAMLSGTIQNLQNTMGYVIDQNEIADSFDPSRSDTSAALELLGVGDQQAGTFQQIAMYRGLQGANARLASDAAAMYSGSAAIYGNSLADKASLRVSYQAISAASGKLGEIAADAQKAAKPAFSLSEIEPYGSGRPGLDFVLPSILALIVFQGAVMGLGRAIAGERRDGSLTRVFLTPTSNVTIISGTMLFYLVLETVRSSIIVLAGMLIFGVLIKGSLLDIFIIIAIYAAGATGLGMIMSVLARSQEQYMALAMLVSLPSMLLAGVFLPVETMPPILQSITRALPITYAAEALRGIMIKGFTLGQVVPDLAFLAVFAGLTLAMSVLLFKRELV